jgi:hypothetical protein
MPAPAPLLAPVTNAILGSVTIVSCPDFAWAYALKLYWLVANTSILPCAINCAQLAIIKPRLW